MYHAIPSPFDPVATWIAAQRRVATAIAASLLVWALPAGADPLPGGTLDPDSIPQYEAPLIVPPAMPRSATISKRRSVKTSRWR